MWPRDDLETCLALRGQGLNASAISRRTGIPRTTVRGWLAGRAPERARWAACGSCGHRQHAWSDLPVAYVYLLGAYLGDGCISRHPRDVFKLRITLDARYPAILDEVEGAMQAVLPRNAVGRVTRTGCVELVSYSRAWPCFFPQHGPGKKHERPIVLTAWQRRLVERSPELLLRGLIHSDGHRFENTGRGEWRNPRYGFTNVSADIRRIFVEACELLGLHTTFARPKTVYVSRKADVARMDEFVGPKA